jgi:type II secretory pathway pseudopilin PulG
MNRISTRRPLAEEGGFTLIEASVAMLLVALMFTALSVGLTGGLRAVRDARLYQQATSIGEEAIEAARDLQYDTLVMVTSDLGGDPRIEPGPNFDPDGSGALAAEPVVVSSSGGSIVPHIITCPGPHPSCSESLGNTPFTISRYVTWVDDADQGGPAQSYKRMVVIIEWQIGGRTNSYVTSSFIALARRGLPVPKFELTPEAQTVQVEQGNLVVFPHTIRNFGIVDTYDLEMTTNPRGWVINFYKDEGQIGTFEPVVDSLLLDTNSTGKPDTGSVNTDETTHFLAVFVLGPTETPGPVDMTLTATSGANNSVTHTSTDTVIVGFAGLTLNLHNNPTPPTGDTLAQKPMAMNLTPVSATTLYKYSTDYYNNQPGRYIEQRNTDHNEALKVRMANWVYQVPNPDTLFNGTVELKLWVARKDLSCTGGPVHIRAFLRTKATDVSDTPGNELTSGDGVMVPVGVGSCPFQEITITMTLTNVTLAANTWLELKVTNRQTSGDAALIAYDTNDYRSTIKLPQVST